MTQERKVKPMSVETITVLELTAKIVSAHIARNEVAPENLPTLIQEVYRSLSAAGESQAGPAAPASTPAVPIHKSVFPDFIVCLESGQKMRMLKRHLMTNYNLTPEAYRAKWGLPSDYPMVAPTYAKLRSQLAKDSGLGRKPVPIAVKPPTQRGKRVTRSRG
jgi:predicted transcriptional regulator